MQSPVSYQQNQEAVQSGHEAQQCVEREDQLEPDLTLSNNDYAHIESDFLRFPFVNQEYFTELQPSVPGIEEMTTIDQSGFVSSENHKNIAGSVLHFHNKE